MNMKRCNHACFVDEVTSSIYVVGRVDDQWKSLRSTEKWTFEENSWQDLLHIVEEVKDQRNYFCSTLKPFYYDCKG